MDDLKNKLKTIPNLPGVYLFRNKKGEVLYIGKAVALHKRVAGYFRKTKNIDPKILSLVDQISDIDYIPLKSEEESLILEDRLVKDYQPKYNVDLKDDKRYPLVEVTIAERWPRLLLVRQKKNKKSRYFGPYTDAGSLRKVLKFIHKTFHLKRCKHKMPGEQQGKPCLYYHLNECLAPCLKKISPTDYEEVMKQVILLLEGRGDELIKKLRSRMLYMSRHKNYEGAAQVRDIIFALEKVISRKVRKEVLKGIPYKPKEIDSEVKDLKKVLKLSKTPLWIDAFDVSNISGKEAVGSLIVFKNGLPHKIGYRRFKIKTVTGIDDYAMIGEIVTRRYRRLTEEKKAFPDLTLIDGGKGQYNAALEALHSLGIKKQKLIGLAKRFEEIYTPGIIRLSKDSKALKLLMRIRDEAHRFAISYHRKLRSKTIRG